MHAFIFYGALSSALSLRPSSLSCIELFLLTLYVLSGRHSIDFDVLRNTHEQETRVVSFRTKKHDGIGIRTRANRCYRFFEVKPLRDRVDR